ncbi:MAG: peptidylprolyl isomerase [Gemmatimonadaceae bacterium]|nr:peptidylprolyl isomerase [Gemmatimonadaceae bacterium]
MLQSMRSAAKYIWVFLVIFFVGGFLLAETSGLLGVSQVTTNTAVATVNGEDIPVTAWYTATQQVEQEEVQRSGRSITLEERDRMGNQAFEQLIRDALLRQEFRRRGISVTDEEITEAARYNPPPQLAGSPELQTNGQFDQEKYQRFLTSPVARQEGLLVQLEQYYRNMIPQQKLFEQVSADAYITDPQLWASYKDLNDSAQVSFVGLDPARIADASVTVNNNEVKDYYDKHKKELEAPGRAMVSVLIIPRSVGPADSAAVRTRLLQLRDRIQKGEKFEDVARSESQDSVSALDGGSLGRGPHGRFVPDFETAAFALKTGELSPPVLTQFGYHLMRVDERKGDTLAIRHILLKLQQSEANAAATDRRADSLARIAATSEDPKKFDEAARVLKLTPVKGQAVEGQPLTINGQFVPSVSSWVFKGARKGETSDLFDWDDAYILARLDSVTPGGLPSLEAATKSIREVLMLRKKLDALQKPATEFARAAMAAGLENAAAKGNVKVAQSGMFTRATGIPELGRANEAVGAAFSLPLGQISAPVKTGALVVVMRVDRRIMADSAKWGAQKSQQKAQVVNGLRQQKIRDFLSNLRESATVKDNRKKIELAQRKATQ